MKFTEKTYLPNNTRAMYTGQGLTANQKKYFIKPHDGMQIANDLFGGDCWAANHFTNKFYGNGTLGLNEDGTFELLEY